MEFYLIHGTPNDNTTSPICPSDNLRIGQLALDLSKLLLVNVSASMLRDRIARVCPSFSTSYAVRL
jgi:hypothetical protein